MASSRWLSPREVLWVRCTEFRAARVGSLLWGAAALIVAVGFVVLWLTRGLVPQEAIPVGAGCVFFGLMAFGKWKNAHNRRVEIIFLVNSHALFQDRSAKHRDDLMIDHFRACCLGDLEDAFTLNRRRCAGP